MVAAARSAIALASRSPHPSAAAASAQCAACRASAGRPSASQQRVSSSSDLRPGAGTGQQLELWAARPLEQQAHRRLEAGSPASRSDSASATADAAATKPSVPVRGQLDALPRGRHGDVELPGGEGGQRPVHEEPGDAVGVPHGSRLLDRGVERLAAPREPATQPADPGMQHRCPGHEGGLPRRGRDRDDALGARMRLLETLELQLRTREVGGGVELEGERRVGHRVDDAGSLRAADLCVGDDPAQARGPRRERDGGERPAPVTELRRRLRCAAGPVAHRAELHPVQTVERQPEHESDALGRHRLVEVAQAGGEPVMRVLVTAEQVLDARARGRELRAQSGVALGHDADALQQGRVAVREQRAPRLDLGPRQQEPHALVGSSLVRQEPERDLQPARGDRRGAVRQRRRGVAQDGAGVRVSSPRGELHVVRALGDRRATCGERLRAALVRTQAPRSRGGFVEGSLHDGMPEPEPPRVAGPVDEVEADQLVHGSQRRRLGHAACRGRELGVERIPDHGRAVERESRVVAQERELLGQIRRDRRGNVEPRTPERPGELLEVEGVATALLVQRLHGRLVDLIIKELASLRLVSAPISIRCSTPERCARSSAAESRPGACRGRREAATRMGASGGRRRRAPKSSMDAVSAQWRSSTRSTSGVTAASRSSRSRTAACTR